MLHSGELLYYYNQNQIQRMKYWNGEIVLDPTKTQQPEFYIQQITRPFEGALNQMGVKLQIEKSISNSLVLQCDWKLYQLAVFNMV